MHIPSNPDTNLLTRLQKILIEKPSLIAILKKYPPIDINLQTLLEVLDTLKAPGVSDIVIKNYLKSPATNWKEEILKTKVLVLIQLQLHIGLIYNSSKIYLLK